MTGDAPVLRLDALSVGYGRTPVLHDISLTIAPGEAHCLLGENGAGKTTLIRTILGRIRPTSGTVQLRGGVGLVPQDIALFPRLTVAENLVVFARLSGLNRSAIRTRVRQTAEETAIATRMGDLVENLSGGWKRRVNIAAAILNAPDLLILDEPTVGVDGKARAALQALIASFRARGMGIILTTHDLGEAATISSHMIVLSGGRIVQSGAIDTLLQNSYASMLHLTVSLSAPPGEAALDLLAGLGLEADGHLLTGLVEDEGQGLETAAILREAGIGFEAMRLERPALPLLYAQTRAAA